MRWSIDEIREFSTAEIIRKLKEFGVDFKEDHFLRDVQRSYSACGLAKDWREKHVITARDYDEDLDGLRCFMGKTGAWGCQFRTNR